MYNNSMVNFHPLPGHPNSIAPRKGRTTGMTPTIVYKDDKPVLVIGAPGATRIITSNLQVILNVLDFGMSISDAVLAPRFDCQGDLIFSFLISHLVGLKQASLEVARGNEDGGLRIR